MTVCFIMGVDPQAFEPTSIADCVAWWDPNDAATVTLASGDVSAWASKATGALTVGQSDAGKRPTTASVGGRTMVQFDGVDEYLFLADAGATPLKFTTGDFSIYAVYKTNDANRGQLVGKGVTGAANYHVRINDLDSNDGDMVTAFTNAALTSGKLTAVGSYADNAVRLVTVVRDGNNQRMYQDGVEISGSPNNITGLGSIDNSNMFSMGANNGSAWFYNGHLGDVLIYNRALNSSERNAVTQWLKDRWGIA